MRSLWLGFCFLSFLSCSKSKDVVPLSSDKSFTSFEFSKTQNPLLPQDVICEVSNDTVYATTFSGVSLSHLTASFITTGKRVTIGNETQTTQSSAHDFSSPVTYTITAENGTIKKYVVKFLDTGLPAVYISTNGVAITSKDNYIPGYLRMTNNLTGDSMYGGEIEVKGRGNSTWTFPKKPYKIKLNKKAALIGTSKSKQWVLLANYADKSLIRNEVGFELSRRLGLAYTPAGKFVDLVLNGEYVGIYELAEQIDVDANKVNVAESGGYLTELDGFASSEPVNFTTKNGMQISVHYPDDEDINDAQKSYITNHYTLFENSLFSDNFSDPVNGYQKYFDLASYVNFYLVNEIIGNPDMFWSTYMYKNSNNDKLFTGPVWDFDISVNNDNRLGNVMNKLMLDAAHPPKQWINRLMDDKTFRNAVRNRWNEIKTTKLGSIGSFVDQLASQLERSQRKNFLKWIILNEDVYLNLHIAGSYKGEVEYLKNYLINRIAWLDTQFNSSRFE